MRSIERFWKEWHLYVENGHHGHTLGGITSQSVNINNAPAAYTNRNVFVVRGFDSRGILTPNFFLVGPITLGGITSDFVPSF